MWALVLSALAFCCVCVGSLQVSQLIEGKDTYSFFLWSTGFKLNNTVILLLDSQGHIVSGDIESYSFISLRGKAAMIK